MTERVEGKVLFTVRRPKSIATVASYFLLIAVVIMIALGVYTLATYERPYDGTDWPELEKRSGLTLYIDHGTGCHWIKAGLFGTLRPRMNFAMKHVCLFEDLRPVLRSEPKPELNST